MDRLPRLALFVALLPRPVLAGDKVTYDDHVFPILQQSCLNCHNPDKTKGGLDLSSYQAAMKGGSGGKIAEPGDSGSKLLGVVMQTTEPKMPPEGDKLPGERIDLLKAWIEGGLLENRSSQARKPTKPKFDLSLKSDPSARPDGPPPMPGHVLLEPEVSTPRASAIQALAASPWAPLLAVTGQRQVLLFDTRNLDLVGVLPFAEGDPVSLAFTPNGRYLIVGGGTPGKSGTTVTFDVTNGERVLSAAKEFDTVLACDLRPDLGMVATGSPSRLVKLWNTADGSRQASIKKHTDWVTALDFSPDGVLLASGDRNGGAWVWEAGSKNEFHTLRAHQAGITAIAFRADSNVLASASEDGTVRFWEMNNGNEIRKIDAHPGGVLAFSWALDGSFATVGRDRKAKLWKPDFGHLRDIGDLPELPTAIALDSEGERVFVATYDGRIVVHQVDSGGRIGEFDSNPPRIEARLATLRERIRHHPQGVAAATAARDDASRRLDDVRQRVAGMEAALISTREGLQRAEGERGKLEEDRKQTGDELAGREAERAQLTTQSAATQGRIDQLTDEHQGLTAALRSEGRETDAAKQRLEALEREPDYPERAALLAEARETFQAHAERLQQLSSRHDEAESQLQVLRAELATQQDRLGAAETALGSLGEHLAGLAPGIDALTRKIETLRPKVADQEKQVEAQHKALAEGERLLRESESALRALGPELDSLRQQERHWSAAAINADALHTAKAADGATAEAEAQATRFAEQQKEFEALAATLQNKRRERAALAAADTRHRAERDAVVAALGRVIGRQEAGLHAFEDRLLESRRELDELLPEAHRLRSEAATLRSRFLEAVAPGATRP